MPIISQCPARVAFAAERSSMRPYEAFGEATGGVPSIFTALPSPKERRCGSSRPPTRRAVLERVFAPSSPNSAASGASPAPTPSRTMIAVLRPTSLLPFLDEHLGDCGPTPTYDVILHLRPNPGKGAARELRLPVQGKTQKDMTDPEKRNEASATVREATPEDAETLHALSVELA